MGGALTDHQSLGTMNRAQGLFGEEYVAMIAAAGGLQATPDRIDFGRDLLVSSPASSGEIRLQVKTSRGVRRLGDSIRYDLDVRSYDYLRDMVLVPRFLVVMDVAETQSRWVGVTGRGTVVRRTAYFASLLGCAETKNEHSITVSVPLANMVTPTSLVGLVEDAGL